ncbi:DUF2807 domain-containing protein [Pontibacter sp. Tf4]|uniref:head GIN domain-containing protein n=1 Tax=Pontibacter sp. Tf4 TaxID=2761620 RepID=UPI0016233C34|nr:head GIN domain-containing protein [Pontibacter sp. Tf4]MBB6609552.1 DUF2807 domain-containing protein [Pontibacter sp. Tf4]
MDNSTKRPLTIFALLLAFVLLNGAAIAQVKGNGNLQTQTRKVSDFNGIKVSGGFAVEIEQGNTESLKIEAEENLMDNIKTQVKNGVLHIYTEGSINSRKGMKAYITVKDLNKIDISGGVKVTGLSKLKAGDFQLDMSGGSNVKLDIEAKKIFSNMSGASKVVLTGRADELKLDMSGASSVNTQDLIAKRVKVSTSGASSVKVHATDNLVVNASGASHVAYAGSPKIEAETTAASRISKL